APDNREGIEIALFGRLAPSEKTVTGEQDAVDGWSSRRVAKPERKIETRALPRKPGEPALENFFGEALAVFRGSDGDDRIGMRVIHVCERQIRVKGRVDAGSHAARTERTLGQKLDHIVFVSEPAVATLEAEQSIEVQSGESGA